MKKILFILATLFAATLCINAQRSFDLPLWEGNDVKDDAADARLYVYLADKPNGQAVVVCPGGGYHFLAMDYEGHMFAPWFNSNGISTFVLKYRMPKQRHEVPLSDAEQAMRIVRNHAKEWGINPDNVGIMGSSAGGHLASTLATHFSSKETRPDFQILLYPVITMDNNSHMGTHNNLIGKNASTELEEKYSNEKQVKDDTPRAFIVLSAKDELVPVKNSLSYAQALLDKGIQVSLHMYPGGYHGFGYKDDFKDASIWKKELMRWLKRNGQ